MRPSIRQVAEKAQVSPMTVSRVLQGRKNLVNEATYQRVLTVLHDLNYVPVRPVVQNRQTETGAIGLVPYHVHLARNPIDSLTFEGACEGAAKNSFDLYIMLRPEAEWMANREELRFLDKRCDGFIFISLGMGEWQTALESLVQNNIPAVACYRRDVPEGVAWIDPDNQEIVRLAVEALVEQGHTSLAYFGGPRPNTGTSGLLPDVSGTWVIYDNEERLRLFREMTAAQGLEDARQFNFHVTDPEWSVSQDEFQALLNSGVTGVICVNDLLALNLWDTLEQNGLKVPEDFSIVGVDDTLHARYRGLTSIAFGYDTVGSLAVATWLELRQGKPAAECCKVVPVQMTRRHSIGRPAVRA